MLAEELSVVNAESPLWSIMRPLLHAALRLEQNDDSCWHGWSKRQIVDFLKTLPVHCTLIVAVWEQGEQGEQGEQEILSVGWVAEVKNGVVCAIRTLDTFSDAGLPAVPLLEPGIEHGLEIMRVAKMQMAPVAVVLFTDKETWNEWLYTDDGHGGVIDKGAMLISFEQAGRCVLMGSQVSHHH